MLVDSNLQQVTEVTISGGYVAGRSFLGWEVEDAGQHLADRQAVRAADGRILAEGEWIVDSATSAEFAVVNGRIREPGLYGSARQSASSDWTPGQLAGCVYIDADHADMVWAQITKTRAEADKAAAEAAKLAARIAKFATRDDVLDAVADFENTRGIKNRARADKAEAALLSLLAALEAMHTPKVASPFGALASLRR